MKVSLLSAVHNESAYVGDMIGSVRAQTHEDWELLFVDDGSTDATPNLIRAAARADQRIRLVDTGPAAGKVRAFNQAFAASSGQVVALLAGDDLLPPDSFARRVAAFAGTGPADLVVAFFKLRTFSDNPKHDGQVLPRGFACSRSGGSITMSRSLAKLVFPIDERLPSEDTWLAYAAADLATRVVEDPEVVMHYRIHDGNSNPRNRSFAEMTVAMHARARAYPALLGAQGIALSGSTGAELQALWHAEELRHAGRTISLLCRCRLPMADRVALAAMSRPSLFRIRQSLFKLLSGRRGR